MCDEHERDTELLLERLQLLLHLLPELEVERAERLVEEQHRRLDHERASEGHALTLAAGEFVGLALGDVLEREGKRFTVRPEKIRILGEGEHADGYHVEGGTVSHVSYAGMITRLRVELDAGGELQVVRQNLETTSQDALEDKGRKVRLGWREEHTYAIEKEKEEKS